MLVVLKETESEEEIPYTWIFRGNEFDYDESQMKSTGNESRNGRKIDSIPCKQWITRRLLVPSWS
jgi:hypothetical protein